ncbi:MAG: hypothetical protein IPG89_18395 [Bacteroidetes bacterium]|nr:hypothetical protein [Bacteroidota bacterium]
MKEEMNISIFQEMKLRWKLNVNWIVLIKWIDIYDFFKAVNPSFGPGAKLSPSHIAEQCKVNSELKMKLESMRKLTGEDNIVARIKKLIEILRKDEFVELESELLDNWKVLSSIHYIENFISLINIPEENEAS